MVFAPAARQALAKQPSAEKTGEKATVGRPLRSRSCLCWARNQADANLLLEREGKGTMDGAPSYFCHSYYFRVWTSLGPLWILPSESKGSTAVKSPRFQ